MWVRVTRTQRDEILRRVAPRVRDALTRENREVGKRDVYIHAPYIAWKLTLEALAEHAFTPTGGRREGTRTACAALRKVSSAMNVVLKHPALRGHAMLGHHAVVIPAWHLDEPDHFGRIFSPAPTDGDFVLLKPSWHDEGGRRLTTWGPDGVGPVDWLNDPANHLAVLS